MTPHQLTIVITTYNRVERLKGSLPNLLNALGELPIPEDVEILVVNNASTDGTRSYLDSFTENQIRVIHNSINQGMLGNLNVCALNAKGRYVWCLGDDDLVFDGAIEEILTVIKNHDVPLLYLNYKHIIPSNDSNAHDEYRGILCNLNESGIHSLQNAIQANSNLMTAIYALVLRRDHAIFCYSVVSNSSPFTSLESCVPTTCYALSLDRDTPVYWISKPLLAVDLRVSWIRYAPIWILERFPEMILRFLDWSDGEADFKYLYDEMLEGIRHWLTQSDENFKQPQTYSYLYSVTKIYGTSDDIEYLNSYRGLH